MTSAPALQQVGGAEAGRPAGPWIGQVLLLAAVAAWLGGVQLAHPGLVDPDEPRTAIVARLMAERGDWLAPHLPAAFHQDYPHDPLEGDLLAYWDKPPLYFWLAAGAMKALGPTALAARLPAAVAQVVTVLLVFAIARRLWGGRAGLLAGLVMALAPLPLVMAHVARMDSLLTALMAAMLLAALRLICGAGRPWVWTLVLYAAAGLGLLAKGPEAVVLPAAAVVVTVALTGRWRDLWRLRPLSGVLISLAIALPWYLSMHFRYPPPADGTSNGFLYEFLVRQHFGRATTDEFRRHLPPGTLLGVLLGGLLPWTVFLPAACIRIGREGWRERRQSPAALLLLAWPLVVLVVFSLSATQLPHYVLPAFPPLAVVIGAYLADRLDTRGRSRFARVELAAVTVLGGLILIALVIGLILADHWRTPYIAIIAVLAGLTVAGAVSVVRKRRVAVIVLLVVGIIGLVTFVFAADPFLIYRERTTRGTVLELEKRLQPGDTVVAYPHMHYSLAWYLWSQPLVYATEDGSPAGEPSQDVLVAELNRPRRTFCVLRDDSTIEALRPRVRWPIQIIPITHSEGTLIMTEPETGPVQPVRKEPSSEP